MDRHIFLAELIDDPDVGALMFVIRDQENVEDYRFRPLFDVECWRILEDPIFKQHFRMTKPLFEDLVLAVGRHLAAMDRIQRMRTPLDLALMMTLWILSTPDTFRSTAVKFGVNRGVVHFHYTYIIEALREMSPLYITWPSAAQRDLSKVYNEEHYGYPGVIGCIDGCHIKVTAPLIQPQRYVNRHHDYSILLQGVCNHKLLFIDVYVGEPGSVGDARTFQRSPLGRNLLRNEDMVDDDHLIGDGAYGLTDKIVVPYRDNGNLTDRQRTHNYYLSRCRSATERAFARLKNKFRRLKFFHSVSIEYAIDHIMASIVLHNFIILEGRHIGELNERNEIAEVDNEAELMAQARAAGVVKREFIADLLFPRV